MLMYCLRRPDWDACAALAASVVNASAATGCKQPACSLGAPQPATAGATFYALTGNSELATEANQFQKESQRMPKAIFF